MLIVAPTTHLGISGVDISKSRLSDASWVKNQLIYDLLIVINDWSANLLISQ